MKAVLYDKRSGAFLYTDTEKPVLKADGVLVQVKAASINAADCRLLKLGMVPKNRIFGSAVAGSVAGVGKGVTRFAVGDSVCAETAVSGFGGLAEYAAVPERLLAPVPTGLPPETAASVPLSAVTALQALREGGIQAGQKILIVGAGGGVGTFAVQLANYFGTEVTAVCGADNVSVMHSLGASSVIDYTKTDIARLKERYGLILAVNGRYPLSVYKRLLDGTGVCVIVGGAISQVVKAILIGRFLSIGGRKLRVLTAAPDTADLDYLLKLVDEGAIIPVIDRRYSLPDAAEGVKYALEGHVRGKIVITPGTS